MNQWYSCSQKFGNPDEKVNGGAIDWKKRVKRKRRRDHPIHAIR
jgi:hypothetical protein